MYTPEGAARAAGGGKDTVFLCAYEKGCLDFIDNDVDIVS